MTRSEIESAVLADLCWGAPHPAQGWLAPQDFVDGVNSAIFLALNQMRESGIQSPGIMALKAWSADKGAAINDLALSGLALHFHVTENVRAKVAVLKRLAARDSLHGMGDRLASRTLATDALLFDATEPTRQVSANLNRDDTESEDETIDSLLVALEQGPDPRAVASGLPSLDHYGSLARSTVTVLAARTSIGKTALACTVALHALIRGQGVCYIAAEEAPRAILARIAKAYGGLARGAALSDALSAMKKLPLSVRHARRVPAIALALSDAQASAGVDLLVIDHLQELHAERPSERIHEIGELLRGIRSVASEANVAVLLLCQLSRRPDSRADRSPELSDIRDSGEIENMADRVWLLHRDDRKSTVATVAVAKNREGPTGLLDLGFLPDQSRFVEREPSEEWAR